MDNKYIAIGAVVVILVAAVGAYALMGGNDDNEDSKPTLVITGSTTINPVMLKTAEVYKDANLQISASGSGQGASDCINGTNDIGMMSRDLKDSEKEAGLQATQIGMDAVAVIVDADAKVSNLTLLQIAQIYAGEITNWNQVNGADLEINPIVREDGSGTRDCFDEALAKVYSGDIDMTGYRATNANGTMAQQVQATSGAIGYVGLSYLSGLGDGVVEISVDGVKASVESTLDGSYEITRSLLLVTKGEPSADEKALIDFLLSDEGQKIVEDEGYVPLK